MLRGEVRGAECERRSPILHTGPHPLCRAILRESCIWGIPGGGGEGGCVVEAERAMLLRAREPQGPSAAARWEGAGGRVPSLGFGRHQRGGHPEFGPLASGAAGG